MNVRPPAATAATIHHRRVDVGALELHVAECGAGAGRPLVVLLHGFPELWWSWRYQLPALAAAGFHAVAPDQRGFNLSDQPRDVDAYRLEALESDVAGLITALGARRAAVVGHDWGGAVAWGLAQHHPSLVSRLAILNAPHPRRFARALRDPRQLWRSSYMLLFQLPWLPERLIAARDFWALRRSLARDGMSDDEIEVFVAAARRTDRLRGGLNYYRAAGRRALRGRTRPIQVVTAPALIIWGERDRFLRPELAAPDRHFVPHQTVARLPHATHWVQRDAPEQVNRLLGEFLTPLHRHGESLKNLSSSS